MPLVNGNFATGTLNPWVEQFSTVPIPVNVVTRGGTNWASITGPGTSGVGDRTDLYQLLSPSYSLPATFRAKFQMVTYPAASTCEHAYNQFYLIDSAGFGPIEFGVAGGDSHPTFFVGFHGVDIGDYSLNDPYGVHEIRVDIYEGYGDFYLDGQKIASRYFSTSPISTVEVSASCSGSWYVTDMCLVPVGADCAAGGDGVNGMTWDVRATDLLVHQLDSQYGKPVKSWNILSNPEIPEVPAGAYLRIDVRLESYSGKPNDCQSGTYIGPQEIIRLVGQTIGRQTGQQGQLIYTPFDSNDCVGLDPTYGTSCGDGGMPQGSRTYAHWIQMWAEPIYFRLWVDNKNLPVGNCPVDAAPPWPDSCRQGELFDFCLSNRHVLTINLTAPPTPRYNCVGGQCVAASDGQYATLAECRAACQGPTGGYNCVGGQCFPDPYGQYPTLAQCQAVCGTPPVTPYTCAAQGCIQDPNGAYATLADCQAACGGPTYGYNCVSGQCVHVPNGKYPTLEQCRAACQPGGACAPGYVSIGGQCVSMVELGVGAGAGVLLLAVAYFATRKKKSTAKKKRK